MTGRVRARAMAQPERLHRAHWKGGHGYLAHRMLGNVISRPPAGESPGVQSGGLGYPDQLL